MKNVFIKRSMAYLTCGLSFLSEKSLEAVAEVISSKLIGGILFVGKDEFIYDQVPAVYAKHLVLGLRVILQGFGGEEGYHLEMYPRNFPSENKAVDLKQESKVEDITQYIAFLLKDVEEIRILT